jgi:cobalt/nickel transport system ATP-binding protein
MNPGKGNGARESDASPSGRGKGEGKLEDALSIFTATNVSFSYDGRSKAVEDTSLNVESGERVAILGANGSGKSTLLKLLDGLYFPTHGEIQAFGAPLTEVAFQDEAFHYSFRRRVGLLFQDSDVQLFSPSVWDEVAFAPLQIGLSRQEVIERVEYSLKTLRIKGLSERAPHRLSGGEKKRVALASLLSLDPQVWLMDEPTAGLDPRSAAWLDDFIYDQGERGRTIVIATHDLMLVESIADRVYLFDEQHKIVAEGPTDLVLADHALLVKCNLVPGHIHTRETRQRAKTHLEDANQTP